ncbi:MAG: NAD-dependent epimerase/dehydratase family protein, partial [Cyclobacteriaceae bacterium]
MEILITGGSGLIGKRLTGLFQKQGHQVSWLVRKPGM